jgi:mutator protein MutT
MRNSTLIFLIRKTEGNIVDICLAMKKRGFGSGRFNGVGGKVEDGETIEKAAIREAQEEIGVTVTAMIKHAELAFTFPSNPSFDQLVHVYVAHSWEGEPHETEEMLPSWLSTSNIPYTEMWPDDIFWLPYVLDGKNVKGAFTFGEGDSILDKNVALVDGF